VNTIGYVATILLVKIEEAFVHAEEEAEARERKE
jgi:hypothetical protein